jgi:hypothetical protein
MNQNFDLGSNLTDPSLVQTFIAFTRFSRYPYVESI